MALVLCLLIGVGAAARLRVGFGVSGLMAPERIALREALRTRMGCILARAFTFVANL